MQPALKSALLSSGLYGPLKKAQRRLLKPSEMQAFRDGVAFYRPFISKGDLCFDVGSNVGDKAEVFLSLGAKVVAFEPQPKCAREIAARCNHHRRLTVVEAAVGSSIGSAQMYVAKWNKVSSLVPNWLREQDFKETIEVPVTTLDASIEKYGIPSLCKIDVEGYELEVLHGLTCKIENITLEYHLTEVGIKKTFDCIDYLSKFGALSMNVTRLEESNFWWPDWVDQETFRGRFPSQLDWVGDFGDLFIRTS